MLSFYLSWAENRKSHTRKGHDLTSEGFAICASSTNFAHGPKKIVKTSNTLEQQLIFTELPQGTSAKENQYQKAPRGIYGVYFLMTFY